MKYQVLTANSLINGNVVFLTSDNDWSPFIAQAQICQDDAQLEALEAIGHQAVDNQVIVEPFLIEVIVENDLPKPVRFREQLRVNGPSVRADFAKPAYQGAW